jgi:hypothetical protein
MMKVLTNELKLKLERLAVLKTQLASFIEYDGWEEVYGGGRENYELPVEIADELIEALETAFVLHAEAKEDAVADAEDAEEYRNRYC